MCIEVNITLEKSYDSDQQGRWKYCGLYNSTNSPCEIQLGFSVLQMQLYLKLEKMKTLPFFISIILLIACNREEVIPTDYQGPLIKSMTSYKDGSTDPNNISNYTYDDRNRLSEVTNSSSGWFTASRITYEYIGDHLINMYIQYEYFLCP